MANSFIRTEDGSVHPRKIPRAWQPDYAQAVDDYVSLWYELFEKAQEKDEFQFILALLRFKGAQGPGWDTYTNSLDAVAGAYKAMKVLRNEQKLNLMLWMYAHIVETNDHYELIANMVNIAGGGPYRAWNFPKRKRPTRQDPQAMRDMTPNEKIASIKQACARLKLNDYSRPFSEVLIKDLRNAIDHSDYSVHSGKIRFTDGQTGFPKEYSRVETSRIVNLAFALHESIKNLYLGFLSSYDAPKVIPTGQNFDPLNLMKAQVIVRREHGVIALQESPLRGGSFSIGIYEPGEKELIQQGQFLLPKSRRERINSVLRFIPGPVARWIVRRLLN